jgi:hypothetical protein
MIGGSIAVDVKANTLGWDGAEAVGFAATLSAGGAAEEPKVVSLFDNGGTSCAFRTCAGAAESVGAVTGCEGASHKNPMPKNTVIVAAATAPTVTRWSRAWESFLSRAVIV